MRKVSKTIAQLNTVVSDQWNYTPGLDLTDTDVLALRITANMTKNGFTQLFAYVLNGSDDDEVIYALLKEEWESF